MENRGGPLARRLALDRRRCIRGQVQRWRGEKGACLTTWYQVLFILIHTQSTRVDKERKKMLNCFRGKNEGTYRNGEGAGGGRACLSDPGLKLLEAGRVRVVRG